MKAKDVIEQLKKYDPEQNLMAIIYDSSIAETTAGTWDLAVKYWDEHEDMYIVDEYVLRLIRDVSKAELEIDTFLDREINNEFDR